VFAVNKRGQINFSRVRGLRKYAFKDDRWERAMDLLAQAETLLMRKAYLFIRDRNWQQGAWRTIRLDLAAFAVELGEAK
jgi:hypothetical protein